VVARWRGNDTTIVLHETPYHGGFGLVLTSTPLDSLARKAAAQAMIMDAREAPAREAARVRAQDEAARAAAEATRTTNKATFQP
jgi:hypothetical protein